MKNQIKKVKAFQQAFNAPIQTRPVLLDSERRELRQRLIEEEIQELKDAAECNDIVGIADAITDAMYILIGTALEYGIAEKLEDCFAEVHRSNMTKLGEDGKPIYRDDGKVLKPYSYEKPNLNRIIFDL